MKVTQRHTSHFLVSMLVVPLFLSAVGIALIPTVEEKVMRAQQALVIKQVEHVPQTKVSSRLSVAQVELGTPVGVLLLPALTLKLPIYQGTSDKVLANGIGLTKGSGDIRGGKGKNPLLAGHSGFIKNNLFDTLDQLKNHQEFFIEAAGTIHAYRVFRIQEVNAEELARNEETYLSRQPEKDLVTLMTCTKEDGNASRLLVVGERRPYHPSELVGGKKKTHSDKRMLLGVFGLLGSISLLVWRGKKHKREGANEP